MVDCGWNTVAALYLIGTGRSNQSTESTGCCQSVHGVFQAVSGVMHEISAPSLIMRLAISLILLLTLAANGVEISSSRSSLVQHVKSTLSSPSAIPVTVESKKSKTAASETPGVVQLAKPSAIIKLGQHVLTIPAGTATRTIDINLCKSTENLNAIVKLDPPAGCLTAGATMVAKLGTNTVTRTVSEAGQTLSLDADCPICNNNNAVVSIGTRLLTIPANSGTVGVNTIYTNCEPVTITKTMLEVVFEPAPTL
ncbi:hypothetical protein NQZ79_g8821 [Umbelopsis isabellina]|nr:hypothetical protein NQZ79_g8821 [Umbelopsis isabellina]